LAVSVDESDREAGDAHFRAAVDLLGGLGKDRDLLAAFRDYSAFLDRRGDRVAADKARASANAIEARLPGAASPPPATGEAAAAGGSAPRSPEDAPPAPRS